MRGEPSLAAMAPTRLRAKSGGPMGSPCGVPLKIGIFFVPKRRSSARRGRSPPYRKRRATRLISSRKARCPPIWAGLCCLAQPPETKAAPSNLKHRPRRQVQLKRNVQLDPRGRTQRPEERWSYSGGRRKPRRRRVSKQASPLGTDTEWCWRRWLHGHQVVKSKDSRQSPCCTTRKH